MGSENFILSAECNNFQLYFNQIIGLFSQQYKNMFTKVFHIFITRLAFFTFLGMNTFLQALMLTTVTDVQVITIKFLTKNF